ncbi:hypothetical protein [Pedobacter xixiisoli]|uniref:Uncharacterized protein n=1 Tax=Pedobacter xixiisoli TaxID=1476464 RepID=A0A285ZRZ0_9SPHI|nr:hypothetical protein [Pedobacter xixiisoli]SOD12423.1 hypothetical protein SAMN06297358_0660 [Pedobacter xixiisoli]
MAEQLEHLRNELIINHQAYLLLADFTENGALLLLAKPFLDLDQVMKAICDDLFDKISFRQHLDIHFRSFGENELIAISIN